MKSDSASAYVDIQVLEVDASTVPNHADFWMPDRPNPSAICRLTNVLIAFLVFHALNAALGIAASFTVVFGLVFSVVLLPLRLCGIQVFPLVAFTVEMLSLLDIALANTIPRPLPLLPTSQATTNDSPALEPTSGISGLKSVHVAYLLAIKPFTSLVSVVVLALSVVLPIQLLAGVHATVVHCATTHVAQPELLVLATVGFWLLGVAGISLGAKASWFATKRFCAGTINLHAAQLLGDFSSISTQTKHDRLP